VSFIEQWRLRAMWRPLIRSLDNGLPLPSPLCNQTVLRALWINYSWVQPRHPRVKGIVSGIGLNFRPTRRHNSYRLWMGFPAGGLLFYFGTAEWVVERDRN